MTCSRRCSRSRLPAHHPGSGDDKVYVRDGETDTVDCGPGFDEVLAARSDVVSPNCERVSRPHGHHR